jgi:flagella basal body P-ring formation protein FlgA
MLFLTINVEAREIPILSLQRDIKKSEVITEDDVEIEMIDQKTDRGYMQSLGDRPVKAMVNLTSGKPLKRSDVMIDRFSVHKGEMVTVQFVRKNLTIDTQGLAMSNGVIGDLIKVKNTDTNKIIIARVTGDRIVAISG